MRARCALQLAGLDEAGDGDSVVPGGMAVAGGAGARHRLDQPVRQHGVAEAHRGVEGFGEGAEVDHLVAVVQPAQGFERLPFQPQVAVVVVLDEQHARASRPVQQLQPAIQTERRRRWGTGVRE